MTARATAQPSGGDGAMTERVAMKMDAKDMTPKALALRDPMPLATFVASMRSVLDDSDKARALVWRQDAYRLCNELDAALARLAAAERVVDAFRAFRVASQTVQPITSGAWITAFERVCRELVAYDAATHPDTGGDHA